MKKCCYIKAGAAVGAAVVASTAFAGDVDRYDVSFANVDYWSFDQGSIDPKSPNYNGQTVTGLEVGRAFTSAGCSNMDTTVCWNTGAGFENWASEMQFAMTATDGTPEGAGFYGVIAPYAGDDTGPATEGTCDPRTAPDEQIVNFTPFSFFVDDTGEVSVAIGSTYNDGVAQRAGTVNTADFFFELGGAPNTSCIGATGDCLEEHPEPGCNDESCCALVCDSSVGGDEFCCSSSWDSSCVAYAVALCDIYVYECDAPAYANDCATFAEELGNGDTISFDTTLANYDGPTISCAADGAPNVWFKVSNTTGSTQALTATTCDQAAYDTALTLWDAGEVGTVFDPTTLEGAEVACNDDGAGCTGYTSTLFYEMEDGRQYLLSVSGYQGGVGTGDLTVSWETPAPQIPEMICDNPGPDSVSQTVTDAVLQDNGVACAAGGITVDNSWARIYSAAEFGSADAFTLDCVNFGVANSGSYTSGSVQIMTTANSVPSLADMTEVASVPFGFYGTDGAVFNSAVFDGGLEVDLTDGYVVVILNVDPSADGFAAIAGGTSADVTSGITYLRSDGCGITDFTPYADIGFDVEWFVDVTGTIGGGGPGDCFGDVNGDGIVDGADFGLLLSAWGVCSGCAEDLDGNGSVDGADVGLLLSAWGECP